jgi:hypothetical protein
LVSETLLLKNQLTCRDVRKVGVVMMMMIVALYSVVHAKHINTLCGQNVEFVLLNLVLYKATIELQRLVSVYRILQWLKQAVANLTPRKSVFISRAVHVRFALDRVTVGYFL